MVGINDHRYGQRLIGRSPMLISVFFTALVWPAQGVHADESPRLGLVANDKALWVFQQRAEPDGTMLLRFAYRFADQASKGRLRPLLMPPVAGNVRHAVVRGTDLHVFYGDGTHRRYTPGLSAQDTSRSSIWLDERILPGSTLPLAIAVDEARGLLLAVVTAEQAEGLDAQANPLSAPVPEAEQGGPGEEPPGAETAQTTEPPSLTDLMLVRYENGRWTRDRCGPAGLGTETRVIQMLATEGVVHWVYATDAESGTLWHQFSGGSDAPWSQPVRISLESKPTHWAGGGVESAPFLVVAEQTVPEDFHLRSLRYVEAGWALGPVVVDHRGSPVAFPGPLSVALFGSAIAVGTLGNDETLHLGTWSLATGEPVEPLSEVTVLGGLPTSNVGEPFRFLIQNAILVGVLIVVFVWRRESVRTVAPVAPNQRFARLGRRCLALLIDLLILSPLWGPAIYQSWRSGAPGLTLAERVDLGKAAAAAGLYWSGALMGVVLACYAAVCEAVTGTTAGKRMVGLSVVTETGARANLGAILIRNAARVVEFHFLPIALLVVLTPSRQRLGDLLARTVVVETFRSPIIEPSEETEEVTESEPPPRQDG